ncbi:MAG: cystathionine beta-lyase [Gammaproteobacteria bacterium CG22_combo_CG10-13_8_21_14_all_40_8]|nr:MAG: cystathionine beta-lyase [Gammaproteobacteria bacterium CG22_combo_CG10-13_8_21_14_all_40_8]
MIYNNIVETIGHTPMVRLNSFANEVECNLLVKCEFMNPGGSTKDRIARQMVLDAEKSGRIKKGDTLIEATSGNTGIGLALAGAALGYKVVITLPEKMSREKQVIIESLGARIVRTPTEAAWDDPASHIGVAKKLQKEIPNAHILDQYGNDSNPMAHYYGTGQEIVDDVDGPVDMVVMGVGTGGTLTGVAKKIKEVYPNAIIVGADPEGSLLAGPEEIKPYQVEGIGYDFIPDVLDRNMVDSWVKTNDKESFKLARRLMKDEGLLVGGSSGSAMMAALKEAKKLKAGQNCVIVLPDGIRNYLTKFVDADWRQQFGFED